MEVRFDKVSKRYDSRWILKQIDYSFEPNNIYGIRGANGSGKSTLLKLISGYLSSTKGHITYRLNGAVIQRDEVFRYIAYSAPYINLFRDFSIGEMIKMIGTFKSFRTLDKSLIEDHILRDDLTTTKKINEMSSGQQQRMSLALSIFQDTPVLLLDEPGSFLDKDALEWFQDLLSEHIEDRTIVIASNDEKDLRQATVDLDIKMFQ